jgi:saccharopine dehydrogenase-like NADP-dependent oxidoreductase
LGIGFTKEAGMDQITLLGAGRVGAAMALDLAQGGEFRVRVADRDPDARARLAAQGIPVLEADLADPLQVKAAARDADLVLGALPGFLGFRALEAVLEAGRPTVDISFFAEDPFRLDGLARSQGVTAVVDCGLAPGCGNLILGALEREFDTLHRFECLVGGLPVRRTLPYEYVAGFSPVDVLEEYTRPARQVAYGEEVVLPALSEIERVEFPGLGTLEAFNTDGLRTLLHTVPAPFKREKTLRYPGHAERIALLRDTGLLSREPVQVGGVPVAPLDVVAPLLFRHWQARPGDEDLTVMRVTVEGIQDGKRTGRVFHLLDRFDRATGTPSMARTTGFTATAAVRLLASGRYRKPGITPPEFLGREPGCWPFIRSELAQRGVLFTEALPPS